MDTAAQDYGLNTDFEKLVNPTGRFVVGSSFADSGLTGRKIIADTYGGAPLLGVKGACIVGHGSSNPTAIKNGILTSARIVREDVVGMISQAVSAQADKAGE